MGASVEAMHRQAVAGAPQVPNLTHDRAGFVALLAKQVLKIRCPPPSEAEPSVRIRTRSPPIAALSGTCSGTLRSLAMSLNRPDWRHRCRIAVVAASLAGIAREAVADPGAGRPTEPDFGVAFRDEISHADAKLQHPVWLPYVKMSSGWGIRASGTVSGLPHPSGVKPLCYRAATNTGPP